MALTQLVHVTGVLGVCATLGFLIGRLIKGRRPAIEAERPRLAVSAAYLRDAHNSNLSPHTRFRCLCESIYLTCCELASARGVSVQVVDHPSVQLVSDALTGTTASLEDQAVAQSLVQWSLLMTPSLPAVPMNNACLAAQHILSAAAAELS